MDHQPIDPEDDPYGEWAKTRLLLWIKAVSIVALVGTAITATLLFILLPVFVPGYTVTEGMVIGTIAGLTAPALALAGVIKRA